MCLKTQSKCFMLTGCVTWLATLVVTVFNVIYIVKGFMDSIGAWPIIGAILATLALLIIGSGLGFLFQSFAYFIRRFSNCKCSTHIQPND